MRKTTSGILATGALVASSCGSSGGTFANQPRQPVPIDLTVYINNSRVSVSPSSVGAGPVIFIITNAANQAERRTILPAGAAAGQPLADTGPINPQATSEVTVNFTPGDYTITTGAGSGSTDASLANPSPIQAATLHIGKPRPASNNVLLQP